LHIVLHLYPAGRLIFVVAAEVFISSDCPRCIKLLEELQKQLGDKFSRAIIVKNVDKEEGAQRDLLKLNFLSTPVIKVEGRALSFSQMNDSSLRQFCTNIAAKV
jgi:hypothetical protein